MKASPFHTLIFFRGKRLSMLASCMTILSKFHIVFSSSALISLNKGTVVVLVRVPDSGAILHNEQIKEN